MPALKQEGYAKDATTLQRIIRRLSEDPSFDPDDPNFCERNILRLQESVADFTAHALRKVKGRAQKTPATPVTPAAKKSTRNGVRSTAAA